MAMEEQARECREDLGLLPNEDLQQQFCDDDGPQLRHRNDSLLRRLNRIDKILNAMEESAPAEPNAEPSSSPMAAAAASPLPASCRYFSVAMTASDLEKRCKPTISVLEEVLVKGTLVERIDDLETRLMKLQRMFSLKSNGKAQSLSASRTTDARHRRVMSCGETYDKQLLQDPNDAEKPNDVEKHEVMQFHSDRPPEKTFHIEHEPFVELKSFGPHSEKEDGPNNGTYNEMFEGVVSSAGKDSTHMKQPITGARRQLSKKKWTKISHWLSKHLHVPLPKSPHKGKTDFSVGRCLGPQVHPLSCCNSGKREMNATPHPHYGHMATYDE